MSDFRTQTINVYAGKFAGQPPCGQITSGINGPQGLYVKTSTHDLYVANSEGFNVLVFHRGQTSPYNVYTDPSTQIVTDVAVAKDGTVIGSNIMSRDNREAGSISTWIGGPNGGTFVGNFPMTNDLAGGFITVQKNGTVFYNDIDRTQKGALWSLSCPAGACGAQTQIAGVSFGFPGGMGSDDSDDLLVIDLTALGGSSVADTFELPNPTPSTFPLVAGFPIGMAINGLDHHIFVADASNHDAEEYLYPTGVLVGTVPGDMFGFPYGIAVDPGHAR
jgi:hypothetical protein